MAEPSEYELYRLSNIARNEQFMANLFEGETHLKETTVKKKNKPDTKEKAKSTEKPEISKRFTRRSNKL